MGDTVCLFLKKYVKGIIGRTEAGSTEITKQMAIDFKISNDKDQVLIKALQYVSEPILKKEFGDATGAWLHRVAHGVDSEILNSRVKPKSLLAMKSFEPKHVDKEVIEWIKTLAGEVHERYLEDRQNFKRRPTNLVLHHRGTRSRDHLEKWKKGNNNATPTSTIRTSLPNISILTQEHIFNIGKKLFYKIEKRLPCSRIGLSMADFVDLPKMGKGSIKNAFGNALKKTSLVSTSADNIDNNTNNQHKNKYTNKTDWNNIDKDVLATLPKEIQREIVSKYSNNNKNAARSKIKKRSIKDLFKNQTCKNNTTAAKKKKNITSNIVPNCFHDIDSNVFAALPENIRSELSNAYNNTRNKGQPICQFRGRPNSRATSIGRRTVRSA